MHPDHRHHTSMFLKFHVKVLLRHHHMFGKVGTAIIHSKSDMAAYQGSVIIFFLSVVV